MYALGSTWLPDVSCFMASRVFSARFHCFALPRAVMSAVYVLTLGLTPFCMGDDSFRLSPEVRYDQGHMSGKMQPLIQAQGNMQHTSCSQNDSTTAGTFSLLMLA